MAEQLPTGTERQSDDQYWDCLAWDDEETADPPYVHIYTDNGCIAALYYKTPEEHEDALEFARRLVALRADSDRRVRESGD